MSRLKLDKRKVSGVGSIANNEATQTHRISETDFVETSN